MAIKRLNQVIAIEKGIKNQAGKVLTDAYQELQKPSLLQGISKTYRPKEEDGDKLPAEGTRVQLRVDEVIAEVKRNLIELFDVVGAKDATNCVARADVVVDGKTILENVPATHLLWLEKQLVDLKTFVSKLPTLDPSDTWHFDKNQNCFATEPVETARNKKVNKPLTLAPATEKHPAQVQLVTEDVLAGYWTTIKFSGALPVQEVKRLSERVDRLQRAVKAAREEANMKEVVELKTGHPVLDYLFESTIFDRR